MSDAQVAQQQQQAQVMAAQQQQLLAQMQARPDDRTVAIPGVAQLRLDPQFRLLNYEQQMGLIRQQVEQRLQQQPEYRQANAFTQRRLLNSAMRNVTPVFEDPSFAARLARANERTTLADHVDNAQSGLVRNSRIWQLFTNDEREELLTSSDMDKYLRGAGLLTRELEFASALYGFGTDAAPSIALGNAVGAAVHSATAARAIGVQRGIRHWMLTQGLSAGAEATVEGAYRTALTYMTDAEKRRVGEYAQIFGTEAALDFAFSRGMRVAAQGVRSTGRIFGRGFRGVQRATSELAEAARRGPVQGAAEVGRAQEASNWMNARRAEIARDIRLSELRLNPEAQLIESAHNANVLVRKMDDGRWAVWDARNARNAPTAVVDTLDDAYEQVGRSLTRQYGRTAGGVEQLAGRPEFDAVRIAQRRAAFDTSLGDQRVSVAKRDELLGAGAVRGDFDGRVFRQSADGEQVGIFGRVASSEQVQRGLRAAGRSGGTLQVDDYLRARGFDSYLTDDGFVFLHRARQVATTIDEAAQGAVRVSGRLTKQASARVVGDAIGRAARAGDSDELVRAIRSVVDEDHVRVVDGTGRLTVDAQDGVLRITRGQIEPQMAERVLEDVRRALRGAGSVDRRQVRAIEQALSANPGAQSFTVPFLSKGAKDNFVDFLARKVGGERLSANQVSVAGQLVEGTPDELAYRLLLRSYDFEGAKRAVREQLGGQLGQTDDGFRLVVGGQTYTDSSLAGILERSGFLPSSSTSQFMPRLAVVDNGVPSVEWQGDVAVGSSTRVRRVLNSLSARPATTRATRLATGLVQVDIPQYGISQQMQASEVGSFVGGQFRRLDNIREGMAVKGVEVYADGGTVKFLTPEGSVLTASTDEELARVMRSIPDVPEGPPLLGQDAEDALSEISAATGLRFTPHVMPTEDEIARMSVRGLTQGSLLTGNTEYAFERLFADRGLPQLQVLYRQLENSRAAATAAESSYDQLLGRLERGMGRQARQRIWHLLNNTSPENMRRLGLVLGEVTDAERGVAGELRAMLDRMHRQFGIRADFLDNYVSHVRRVWQGLSPRKRASLHDAQAIIRQAYPNSQPPRELTFFAEHLRKEHFVDYLIDDDAFSSMRKYVRMGSFTANTRQSYAAFRDAVQRYSGQLGSSGIERVNHYLSEFAGGNFTRGEKFFNNIVGDFAENLSTRPRRIQRLMQKEARRLGGEFSDIDADRVWTQASAAGRRAGQDFMSNVYGMTYFANLGFKPFLAVRNSLQVWTTLAPRFSNAEVLNAVRYVNQNPDQVADVLRRVGVIADRPPIVEGSRMGTLVQRANERALRAFTNSDHYTRAVSYVTASRAIDTAVAGGFLDAGAEAFAKKSGTEFLNPVDRDMVFQLARSGDLEGARRMFGTLTTERTMFGYRPSQSPALFRQSMIGKIAGRFGTYSAGYRANILSAFEHGTGGGKAKFFAVMLQNSAALSAMFASLGVRYTDFVPGMPALFSGGPTFDLLIDLFQSFDTGYSGQQARGELRRRLDPTSIGQARQIRNALDHLDRGDSLSAFAALGGVPLLD